MKDEKIDWDDWDDEEIDPSIPEEFNGNELFYNFLVENDIYESYINNFKLANLYGSLYIKYFFDKVTVTRSNYICLSFVWKDFSDNNWKILHDKWIMLLNKEGVN